VAERTGAVASSYIIWNHGLGQVAGASAWLEP